MKGLIDDRLAELSRLYPVWEKKTIWEFFKTTADRCLEWEFIHDSSGENFTYAQARQQAEIVAKGLLAAGVKPGDHVAVQLENSPRQLLIALAVNAVRAVKVPVNISLASKELQFILNQSEANYLLTDSNIRLTEKVGCLTRIIALEGACCQADIPVISWEDFLAAGNGWSLPSDSGGAFADEVCDIIYTSGSTKAPKGVMLTHDMLMRSAFASCINRGFEPGRRIYIPLPLFHVYGYVEGMLAAILVGGAVLLRCGKFIAEPVLDFMRESRANDVLSVPVQMMALIRYLREQNTLKEQPKRILPDLHAVYCSASACPAWVWPGIRETLGVSDIITGYGMTEVCGASMQTAPQDSDHILESRVGRVLNGGCSGIPSLGWRQIEYRVVDAKTGKTLGKGETGELWCRGLVVTPGYFNRPEANQRVFTKDGWFKTGDCGYFDDAGYLVMAGRVDDMYKINGENVSPKFLEDVLGNCPEIFHVEVVGVADERHGHVGAAFIQLREDTEENRKKAEAYSREHLAKFQVPKYFIYLDNADWPRTSTGKVQKFRLIEMANQYSS